MMPFIRPLAAMYLGSQPIHAPRPEPVAILATSDAEYLAVNEAGETIIDGHVAFNFIDDGIRDAVWQARMGGQGS